MSQFTVSVTQSDIDSSSKGDGTNALAKALYRMRDALQLPECHAADDLINCQTILCQTQVYNGYDVTNTATLITECNALVCYNNYATDHETAIKIALQNIGDIKPSAPFTATLTLR